MHLYEVELATQASGKVLFTLADRRATFWFQSGPRAHTAALFEALKWYSTGSRCRLKTQTHTSTASTIACLTRVSKTPFSWTSVSNDLHLALRIDQNMRGLLSCLKETDFTGSLSPRLRTLTLTEVSWICCYFDEDNRVAITNKHGEGFSHTAKCLHCQGSVAQLRPTSEVIKHELLYKAELLLPQLRAVSRARASGMKERETWRTSVSRRIQESACARWPPGNPRELARAAFWRISLYI